MPLDVSPLFAPLTVRGKVFRNRIVMPPMVSLTGLTRPEGIEWYGSHARGGVGLVIIEATAVNRFGSELTVETLTPVVKAIHEGGALAAIQLFPVTFGRKVSPADLSHGEIEEILAGYRVAAGICREAGFDGLEPHGAHGFVLNQFFSPIQNRRTDRYGGDETNRMRMALDIVKIVRSIAADDMIVLYRHTPVGQGYGIDESLVFASELVAAGVDILDISPSSIDRPGDRAAPFKALGVPVITVNELDKVERALEAINEARADLVGIGRGLIADREWPNKVRDGHLGEIVSCVRCDEGCYGNLSEGVSVECTQWA